MKLNIDTDAQQLKVTKDGSTATLPLYSTHAFKLLSDLWSKVGWDQKYTYTFTWMGVPIVQLPEDMIRLQEVIWRVQPDVIIECGVAHGGGVIFYTSLCRALGKGRVIGVEIEFRGNHREQIERHILGNLITLIEGSSTDPAVVQQVQDRIAPGESVMVILDSNHSREHVAAELEMWHKIVTPGSYIVATDGIMEILHEVPRGRPEWKEDNPAAAARAFAGRHPAFTFDPPSPVFNESELTTTITHWPNAWLKRIS